MSFSNNILRWFDENGRVLPWRGINDAYKIWLSEIILQQTRIEQGRDYYYRFIETYPTVVDLASASEESVLKTWQGLGYYSRARNLHTAAQYIVNQLGGQFPNTYEGILRLKGVGRYTAAAIASFAFKLPYPVIDGNVYRFISRLYGITTPVPSDTAYKEFESILLRLIDTTQPDRFNHAIMDFGSLQCKVRNPNCDICIFYDECVARRSNRVDLLPVKAGGVTIRSRWFYYYHVEFVSSGEVLTLVQRRKNKDIWQGLFEFPLQETTSELSAEQLKMMSRSFLSQFADQEPSRVMVTHQVKHQLTHQTIYATFIHAYYDCPLSVPDDVSIVNGQQLRQLPIAKLTERYLSSY